MALAMLFSPENAGTVGFLAEGLEQDSKLSGKCPGVLCAPLKQ